MNNNPTVEEMNLYDRIKELERELESSQMKPIETAPKESGVTILGLVQGVVKEIVWNNDERSSSPTAAGYWDDYFHDETPDQWRHIHPTHWMPMPELPTDTQDE